MANFTIALKKVLKNEGGYANNPNDAGGETYKGISRNLKIEDILQILDDEPYYVTESNGTNINSRNRTLPKARPKYAKRDPWSNYEGKSFGDVMKNSTLYNNKVILDNNAQDE